MKEQEENKRKEVWETPEVNIVLVEETETGGPLGGLDGPFVS